MGRESSQHRTDAAAARVYRLIDGIRKHSSSEERKEPPALDEPAEAKHRLAAAGGLIWIMGYGGAYEEHAKSDNEAAAYTDTESTDLLNDGPHR